MKAKSRMKIVLCTVPQDITFGRSKGEAPVFPKIAIISLLKWIEKEDYVGDFFDIDMLISSKKEIFDYFKNKQPDVVGISAVVSTSYLQVKNISKIIRKACPSATIVIGSNMAVSANLLLRKTEIDFCVLGDGEITFVNLLNYIRVFGNKKVMKRLLEIKGLAFINEENEMEVTGYGEPIGGEENPFPDYEILKKGLLSKPDLVKDYFKKGKEASWFKNDPRSFEPNRKPNLASAWVSKGCVARCTFCQRFSKGFHTFDLKKFEDHIIELKNKYDVQFFNVLGENFGLPIKFAYDVAKILKKHDMLWSFCGRCTNFKPEDYAFFKAHGCAGIKFGIESGSQKILDIMEKRFTVEQVYEALKLSAKYDLLTPLSFCIGMPGETDETIMQTGRLAGELSRLRGVPPNYLEIFYALPLPGSVLYEYGQLQGVIGKTVEEEEGFLTYVSDRGAIKDIYFNLTGISNRKVIFWDYLLHYEATRTFYSKPLKEKNNPEDISAIKKTHKRDSIKGLINLTLKNPGGLKNALLSPISSLNAVFCRNRYSTKIPRKILYPLMRNLLYAEYLTKMLFKYVSNIFINNKSVDLYFKFKRKKCKVRIKESESLRKINNRIKENLPPPKSLTEKNQRLLYEGR